MLYSQIGASWASTLQIFTGMDVTLTPSSNVNVLTAGIQEAERIYFILTKNKSRMNEEELVYLLMYIVCNVQLRHPILLMHLTRTCHLQNSLQLTGEKGRSVILFSLAVSRLAKYCKTYLEQDFITFKKG